MCTHPVDLMGMHFVRYVHGNECIGTYDAIHDTFATIARDASFHVGWKQLHVLPSITFNSFHWWVNIVFTKDGICTLTNIVIVDPTQIDLLPWSYAIQGFVTFDATQAKERIYYNQHPIDQFLPLAIENIWLLTQTCRCVFTWLCQCHLELERAKGPSSFYLGHFSSSKNSITLQRMQTFSILSWAVTIGLATSQLPPLHDTPPITMCQFFTYKFGQPIVGSQLRTWKDFHNYFEPTWHPIISPFSLILLLCTFP